MSAAVVGGTIAAVGQAALTDPPSIFGGSDLQRLGITGWFGSDPGDTTVAATRDTFPGDLGARTASGPTSPLPQTVNVAGLMEITGINRPAEQIARATAQARAVKSTREAQAYSTSRAQVDTERSAAASLTDGGVQMLIGRITSGFGPRWDAQHKGLDIAAPIGTPVRAPLDGVVINSGPASGFGLWVRVRHDDGTITLYGHINRTLVEVGQRVKAGDVIAQVGNRGQSTGPHLHFEVITDAGNVNPTPWLTQRGVAVT